MKLVFRLFIFLIVVFAIFLVAPQINGTSSGSMTLLTVTTDSNNNSFGGTANLDLTIKPGTGKVFLATFPFSKLDTQISTRFANEIACSLVSVNCDNYDFFYTITARSSIIGGPSAGAALTALTVSLLDNAPLPDDVAMTGTISAGGIVGPVGGVEEKVRAGAAVGLKTIVVPLWDDVMPKENLSFSEYVNATVMPSYPDNVTVIEVSTITDALYVLTGKEYRAPVEELTIPYDYTYIMSEVADQLCNRSQTLLLEQEHISRNNTLLNMSIDFLNKADVALENNLLYSRASYCFSANLRLRELQLQNFSDERLATITDEVNIAITTNQEKLDARKIETFTDLQTKAIVDERFKEAQTYLQEENVTARDLAYAIERYRSGIIWSNFFELGGAKLQLDEAHLKRACEAKIAEVEERTGYLSYLFGSSLTDTSLLEDAQDMYAADDFALCLFKASKAKAQVDVIISSIAISEENLPLLVEEKLLVAKSIIHRESISNRFPIMGYSYYEYALSLQEDDPYTATLFSSYALELGDLSLYFSEPPSIGTFLFRIFTTPFVVGFLAGFLVIALLLVIVPADRRKKK